MAARVVVFAGEYDIACRALLQKEFARLEAEPVLVLDFSAVTYLDSTCLLLLLKLNTARAANRLERESIVLADPCLERLFQTVGLNQLLRVVASREAAIGPNAEHTVEHAFYADGYDPVSTSPS